MPTTARFSRRFRFVRKRTSIPMPAFDRSPAKSPPRPMMPERKARVRMTETEQFGMRPSAASSSAPSTGLASTVPLSCYGETFA